MSRYLLVPDKVLTVYGRKVDSYDKEQGVCRL